MTKGPNDAWMVLDVEADTLTGELCTTLAVCKWVISTDTGCGNLDPSREYQPEKAHVTRGWEGPKPKTEGGG